MRSSYFVLYMILWYCFNHKSITFGGSSNGRTVAFEAINFGSIPSPPAPFSSSCPNNYVFTESHSQLLWPVWASYFIFFPVCRFSFWYAYLETSRCAFRKSLDLGLSSYNRGFHYSDPSQRNRGRRRKKPRYSSFLVCQYIAVRLRRSFFGLFGIVF